MPRMKSIWTVALILLPIALIGGRVAQAQETLAGERLDPALYGPGIVESLEAAASTATASHDCPTITSPAVVNPVNGPCRAYGPPPHRARVRTTSSTNGATQAWESASPAWSMYMARISPASPARASRPRVYAWSAIATVRKSPEPTGFQNIADEPAWFGMDLRGVDRIEIQSVPVVGGAGWYALDDLTYSLAKSPSDPAAGAVIVVDFDDLAYGTSLTATGYHGLTWETGNGRLSPAATASTARWCQPVFASATRVSPKRPRVPANARVTPTVVTSFQGSIRGDAGANSYPPDTTGAVGPDHFVETVNRVFSIYEKDSGNRVANMLLGSFLPGSSGDPRVLFDHHSGRWIVAVGDFRHPPLPGGIADE